MAFWGVEVKPGKVVPFVPPPEGSKLHLSQASLGLSAPAKSKSALKVKVGDGEPLVLCCLREGGAESQIMDLLFDSYAEFSVEGPASVHLSGYYMPEYELDDAHDYEDDEDDEDEDGMAGQIIGYDEYGVPVLAGEYDSEEDSDYESGSDDGLSSDDDEEGSDSGEDSEGLRQLGRGRKVVIEEITDDQPAAAPKALPAPEPKGGKQQPAQANGKAAEFGDEDVGASDEEEEEGSEEEESEEEEAGSEEEEESEEEAPQQAQQAGQKRKGVEAPAPAPAKKQAVEAQQAKQAAAAKQQKGAPTPAKTPQPQQQKQQQQQEGQQPKSAAKQQSAQQQAKTPGKTPGKEEGGTAADELPSSNQKVRRYANGFELEEVKRGRPDAKLAKPGKKVVVKYVGRLKSNGKIFDRTEGNRNFAFRLGVGEVIKGWDTGINGMRVGDKRKLTIPPQMAYGSSGVRGSIPPNATLVFDVELVDVKG